MNSSSTPIWTDPGGLGLFWGLMVSGEDELSEDSGEDAISGVFGASCRGAFVGVLQTIVVSVFCRYG
jgi:hypothetical protein